MMGDAEIAKLGARPKVAPRPQTRSAIGMHGWLKSQADIIDTAKATLAEKKRLERERRGSEPGPGRDPFFQRIGGYTVAPGFNPGRWTTYVAGRPTVVLLP